MHYAQSHHRRWVTFSEHSPSRYRDAVGRFARATLTAVLVVLAAWAWWPRR